MQTVLGAVDPSELGFTLPHEHTQIALWHTPSRWDYLQLTRDQAVILDELADFTAQGGRSIVDLTLPGVGRDPNWLVDIARLGSLNIVMGCGWYREPYYPPEARLDRRTVDDLADELVVEAKDGVGLTGVKPGIIGEIGANKPWISALEERVHRAAARASRRTGLAITTHAVMSPVGLDQLVLFEQEGADPSRVIIGHADSYPQLDHYLSILDRGASIEFDFLGMSYSVRERLGEGRIVEVLCELLERGKVGQVLLSQDVCEDAQLRRYEGHGYTYLARTFLPRLRDAGVSEAEIETMTIANPRRMLTID